MHNEYVRDWNKMTVVYLKFLSWHLPGKREENYKIKKKLGSPALVKLDSTLKFRTEVLKIGLKV